MRDPLAFTGKKESEYSNESDIRKHLPRDHRAPALCLPESIYGDIYAETTHL